MLVLKGGNGFIGRHTAIEAARRGEDVTVVAPRPDPAFLAKHAPTARALDLQTFEGDSGDSLIRNARAIVYLAARSVPATSMQDPVAEIDINLAPAFQTFLRVSRVNPAAKIILISSGGTVYGKAADHADESHPLRPISPYGLSKVMAEQALIFCGDAFQQRYAILRVSNPIGRWHDSTKQGLVGAVLRSIRQNTSLIIYGDGSAVRDYLDADDLADAILRVAHDERFDKEIWNVGSGRGASVLEIVNLVSSLAGASPKFEFRDARATDADRVVLDCSKIARDLGWKAMTGLPTSVERVVKAVGQ